MVPCKHRVLEARAGRGELVSDAYRVAEKLSGEFEPPFEPGALGDGPWRSHQWRARVTRFAPGGYEVVASLVDRERARDQWERHQGFGVVRRARVPDAGLDPESVRRSRQRAQVRVRHLAKNIGASHLLTLSTRQRANTREEMFGYWARFLRLYERAAGKRLAFIAVLERHPTNPGHLHLHVAVTSFLPVGLLRRLWYIALGGTGSERGERTPGGVNMRQFRAAHANRRATRIARYIAKYLTKDTAEEFNKKRYSCSKGAAEGIEAHAFWLAGETQVDALAELFAMFSGLRARPEDLWLVPGGRRVWAQCAADGAGADPPF